MKNQEKKESVFKDEVSEESSGDYDLFKELTEDELER